MRYGLGIFLIAAAVMAATLFAQIGWTRIPARQFKRKRARLGIALLLIFLGFASLHYMVTEMEKPPPDPTLINFSEPEQAPAERLRHPVTPPYPPPPPLPVDGRWRAVSIGGQPARGADYWIELRAGRVTGGRDGCNSWGYVRLESGWGVESTLVGCPEDPLRTRYFAALDPEQHEIRLREDGTLIVATGGNQARFKRRQD